MENTLTAPQEGLIKKLVGQFGKFIIVGVINTLIDLIILNIETKTTGILDGSGYAIQKGISFLFAVSLSYFINKSWTFEDKSKEAQTKKFSQFMFVSIIGMIINVSVATTAVTYVKPLIHIAFLSDQLWVSIGALCGTAIGLFWNFIGYKFWVFKK